MRTKLIMLLISVALISMAAVGAVAWFTTQGIVRDNAVSRLVSIREDRAYEIETYFSVLRDEITLLAQDEFVKQAMAEFVDSYHMLEDELQDSQPSEQVNATVTEFYESEFLPSLEVISRQDLEAAQFMPKTSSGIYLQNNYIANNTHPIGSKNLLVQAKDESAYSATHLTYHPFLNAFIDLFGYYDLFLIDPESRHIVYSVFKEVDFATSLEDGPYADSGLSQVVELVLSNPTPNEIRAIDFSPYRPSGQKPAAFFATPLFQNTTLLGVLVIQVPIDEINSVMTGNAQWEEQGLGKTGETYLVGQDHLMRSMSRLLVEDTAGYSSVMREAGVEQETLDQILSLNTSILLQEVLTESAESALSGESDIQTIESYQGTPALSAYAPLMIDGLNWAIIAEMNESEINTPLMERQASFLTALGGLSLLLLLFCFYAASRFTRSIRKLALAVGNVGNEPLEINDKVVNGRDEIGQLATKFNLMRDEANTQQATIKEVASENQRLMLSILPAPIAARVKEGERDIAEEIENVTLMFAYLSGIHRLTLRINDPLRTAELLNVLTERLESASVEYNVERDPTLSNRFMAVCGLNDEEGERVENIVRYAIESQKILLAFNEEFGSALGLKIGIHNGSVLATVLESDSFRFELWGSMVEITDLMEQIAPVGGILVSHEVYMQVQNLFAFEPYKSVDLENDQKWRVWQLIPSEDDDDEAGIVDRFAAALAGAERTNNLPASLKPRKRRGGKRFIQNI